MARGLRQWTVLAPSGHPAVDELWITRQHDIRTEAETLHHAGTKAFDQRVGIGEKIQHLRDRRLVLQVEFDDLAAASRHRFQILLGTDPIQGHDLRAHVGQHHAGERSGADAGEFDDTGACERTGDFDLGLRRGFIEHVVIP
jgi:hypothetical protein